MTAAALFLALAALLVSPSTDGWAFVACLVVFAAGVLVALVFARPSGDHDVTPDSPNPPAESGVTISYAPRTAHLVSAPARAVEPSVPARVACSPLPARAGTTPERFVTWLARRLVPICVTLLGGSFACLAAAFLLVVAS